MSEVKSKQFNHPILITGGAEFFRVKHDHPLFRKKLAWWLIGNLSNSVFSNLQTIRKYIYMTIPLNKIGKSEWFDEEAVMQTFCRKKPKFILIQNVNKFF